MRFQQPSAGGKSTREMSNRFQQTERAIEEWATERGLDTADPKIQCLKLLEETGELAQGLLKGNEAQVIDSIGDVAVVLIIVPTIAIRFRKLSDPRVSGNQRSNRKDD